MTTTQLLWHINPKEVDSEAQRYVGGFPQGCTLTAEDTDTWFWLVRGSRVVGWVIDLLLRGYDIPFWWWDRIETLQLGVGASHGKDSCHIVISFCLIAFKTTYLQAINQLRMILRIRQSLDDLDWFDIYINIYKSEAQTQTPQRIRSMPTIQRITTTCRDTPYPFDIPFSWEKNNSDHPASSIVFLCLPLL